MDVMSWPAVRDVVGETHLSATYVLRLIKTGRLDAVRTRLGLLVDPASVARLQAERKAAGKAGLS
jgi:hypothetical protein